MPVKIKLSNSVSSTSSETAASSAAVKAAYDKAISSGMPVNSIYIQYAWQSAPADIFGGTWQNISSSYAGYFFRAEGGNAPTWNTGQDCGAPNIIGEFLLGSTSQQGIYANGCFATGGTNSGDDNNGKNISTAINFYASRSNGYYGAATEIRPKNLAIRIWKRTA